MVKIVAIGAGSGVFGHGVLTGVIGSKELNSVDCNLVLVDVDKEALKRMYKLAGLLKKYYDSSVTVEATDDRVEALPDADYVIISVARRRYQLWEQDFRLPLAYGFKHVLGENGGPGAVFHTMRSLHLIIPICRDMETLSPNALVLNYSNPESRVIMAINYLTKLRSVGLCHGVFGARGGCIPHLGTAAGKP